MIAYIAIPYSVQSIATQNEAIITLNKHFGKLIANNPSIIPVNALYSVYKNPQMGPITRDVEVYPACRTLIEACNIFIVLRDKGWEYSDIIMNETAYAANIHKPIYYEDVLA